MSIVLSCIQIVLSTVSIILLVKLMKERKN